MLIISSLRNIPYYSKRLELPIGKKVVLLLKYLAAEHDIPYGGDERFLSYYIQNGFMYLLLKLRN